MAKTKRTDGRTELHYAAADADAPRVRKLLARGLDPSAADASGWTPLHFAAQSHSAAVLEILLDAGAKVDAQDKHGNTALWRAVFESRGRGGCIKLLRSRGAAPAKPNRRGVSPVDLARTIANFDVARWFADLSPKVATKRTRS
jgi:uncharacterized protein